MKKKDLEAFALEADKGIKTKEGLTDFQKMLTKVTVEAALSWMIICATKRVPNSRNGRSRKTVITNHGEVYIETPRDRDGPLYPKLVRKQQTRLTSIDDRILSRYAKGLSTRDIVATFKEMYDVDVSPNLISKVTEPL